MADVLPSAAHDPAEELLPWYATGQLAEAERTGVEAHLASCLHCRQQLAVERRLIEEFRDLAPEVESGWSRLRARIDRPAAAHHRLSAEVWRFLSRPAVATLAAAQLAFLVLGGALLISLSRPAYHALGAAPPPPSANVIVIFAPDASEQAIRTTLDDAGASIVGGPTDAHAYLLHVAPDHRPASLARLQATAAVRMAQPIDGAAD